MSDRPVRVDPHVQTAARRESRFRPRWFVVAMVFGLSLLGLLLAHFSFGSVTIALRYLRGERLILAPVDLRVEGLTRARPVTVAAEMCNFGSRPVRVLGSAVNCTCVTVKEEPRSIPAGGRSSIVFEVRALPGKPDVDQHVVFFTDHPSRPRVGIHVTGLVRD